MGAFLDKPITDKHTEEGSDPENGIRYGLCSMQGWRIEMEDAHVASLLIPELPGWSFFAVLDGHAGNIVADYSAKLLLSAILSTPELKKITLEVSNHNLSIFNHTKEQLIEIEKGIKSGFLVMDRWLYDLPEAKNSDDRSGSTVVCCFVTPSHIILVNCGDSRGVLFSGKGTSSNVVMASLDHKPILPKERERIIAAGGYVMIQRINGSLAVSRALGDFDYKTTPNKGPWEQMVSSEPDLYVHERSPNDQFLILACDGIWDVINNKDACDLVRSRLLVFKDLKNVVCNLIDTCFSKGSRDNMSAVIICFKGAPKESADARARDAAVNAVIETKVGDILKKPLLYEVSDMVQYIMSLLEKEPLNDLPPGGGIFAKRDVIENICKKHGFHF